jgi:Na+-transporting NADH:ubiquinone oxidoreductase subunit NqrB
MVDGFMLKFLGELFYLIVAVCAVYVLWDLSRSYRAINSTVIKTHITAYELRKMIGSRSR